LPNSDTAAAGKETSGSTSTKHPKPSLIPRDSVQFLTYCAAKHAHLNRKKCTPRGIPWPEWFRQKFGTDLF